MIDPQSDFADYIIKPGSMSWSAIDAQTKTSVKNETIEFAEAANHLWQGKLTLKET